MQLNCKEDTSLFTEFTKIIATLEQEFEGVEPEFPPLSQLEYRSWPSMQSVESQFELRNVISLSINPPTYVSVPFHLEVCFKWGFDFAGPTIGCLVLLMTRVNWTKIQ